MRNFIACLLLPACWPGCLPAARTTAISLRPQSHVERKPILPATETPQQKEPPTAGNRSELRGAMLSFVRNWTEQGEIRISGYSGDLTADLTETVRYITGDPIGAYACGLCRCGAARRRADRHRRGQHRVPPLCGGDRCYRDREQASTARMRRSGRRWLILDGADAAHPQL